MIKKILLSPWTALLTLAIVLCIRIEDPKFVESIKLNYFDTLISSKAPTENNIYTVNIDEASIDKYGWPIPRADYAKIVRDLYSHGAGLVVLDVLMSETDRTGGDSALGQTLSKYPVVLTSVTSNKTKNTPRAPGSAVIGAENIGALNEVTYAGLIANVPQLENAAAGVGIISTMTEVDGVTRRLPLVVAVDDKLYPGLALETLRVATGNTTFQIKLSPLGVDKMRLPGDIGIITTDAKSRVWVDWSQKNKQVSLSNLPKDFGGAIVIVGPTAAGIANPVPTSLGSVWPQDVQAAVMGTMINKVVIERPAWADYAEIGALAVMGIVLLFLTRWTYVGLASVIGFILISVFGSRYAFNNYLYLIDSSLLVCGVILVSLHAYGIKFVSEFLQKQQIKKQFGSYVSPVIVERLQKNPELIKLGGEEKMLTAVMTDMRNFTGLGEKYGADVQGFTKIMNEYMTAISQPVFDNDGCLIKFIGDASLHIHGAPLDDANHAVHGVKTALEMIESVEKFNEKLVADGKPKVGMGAGVNTGKILVGNIGSPGKMGYDVLGDPVSVASRLEGQTKGYGVLIIIGPDTNEQVQDVYATLELDCIAVKGKAVGLRIYTPIGTHEELYHTSAYVPETKQHEKMLELYRLQQFDMAIKFCEDLKGSFLGKMDHYYELWIERCKEMKTHDLPKDWDGVYRATSK